ncbi:MULTISPECIES: hypothetical protein [unclassified Pseudoalteromonas]|uniref:hypothetical protein n=1 Tax=unclassified Pseudoalteromonas TaxID=194690 RepID=UPI0025B53AD5|nr:MULTISPECIES: hypothetical protein [unclassified Pseudoalteromonas]MDN3379377.1 hypothetical protein [Pseudoalteromonas sp. APC 3893]MDN3386551.1 hypothetical protein [Pseudoalteromonas sp. APC 4017]
MNKSLTATLLIALSLLLYTQFSELAYKFGFAELKLVAVLENPDKMKVKCDAYSLGFFDEIKLQNKYQKCINEYEAQGYELISRSDR